MRARPVVRLIFLYLVTLLSSGAAMAAPEQTAPQDSAKPDAASGKTAGKPGAPPVLFENVRIFDGTSPTLSAPSSVLIRGNIIEKVAPGRLSVEGARVIDGGGRTLMPGLIDMHWHSMLVGVPINVAMRADIGYLNIVAGVEARKTLLRGFTTVRDVGGASFGLKDAIDQGVITGPRIYPSGAMISVTGGHGDFREFSDLPRVQGAPASRHDIAGDSAIADSPDEVRMRVREQLMRGASQIKLTAGGGVSSPHSPLDIVTFTDEELRAAVGAASDRGTYVTVHAYMPEAIQRAIKAGVKCIEHGTLMDEQTARQMASAGTWLSTQPFPDDNADKFPQGSDQWKKAKEVVAGTDRTYRLAIQHKLKTAFGTDILFSPQLAERQGQLLASLTQWYSPSAALIMATSTNAQLLKLSGKRNPYPGELGVVREGALADLLLVDGDPLQDIALVANPGKNFVLIMKNGVIVKDILTLQR